MTIYDFVKQHRVEVIVTASGVYNCYIDYEPGNNPSGQGSNILEALDIGVANYLNNMNPAAIQKVGPDQQQQASDALRKFLSKEALFVWYYFARKYNMDKIVGYYEDLANTTHPTYCNTLRFLYDTINKVMDDMKVEIVKDYPAISNIFVQALVYYESLKIEKYENNTFIKKMLENLKADDINAFYVIQDTIKKVDIEIQKPENNG